MWVSFASLVRGLVRRIRHLFARFRRLVGCCLRPLGARSRREGGSEPASEQPVPDLARTIQDSGWFDAAWYADRYPEAVAAGAGPLEHFVSIGDAAGFDPNPYFDTDWYLKRYPDVAAAGMSALDHYLSSGEAEGRDPNPYFDTDWYLNRYPDVRAAGVSPLGHFISSGRKEGRQPSPIFALASVDARPLLPDPGAIAGCEPGTIEEPLVSIVIPVHGQWHWTERCLRALERTEAYGRADVIVLNDASPDNTAQQMSRYPWARLVTLTTNLGFTKAVNVGASHAKGRFILFLNNDTEPLPGFVDSMVEAMEGDPTIGMVGSRLIFPDGSLQEAGAVIWDDGHAEWFGAGRTADYGPAQVRRDVDYSSGASLLIRRDLFERLGGFDERYAPAYYEDVDLAFEVRNAGLRVVYEPRSIIVHHHGGSHGTDVKRGVKAYQVTNHAVFVDKWREVLRGHCRRETTHVRIAAARGQEIRQTILFIDHDYLTPKHDAGSMRSMAVIEQCQRLGFESIFTTLSNDHFGAAAKGMRGAGVFLLPGREAVHELLRDEFSFVAAVFASRVDVFVDWWYNVLRHYPEIPVVFDTVDLHHVRMDREAVLSGDRVGRLRAASMRRRELWAMRQASSTLVVSEAERTYLAPLVPGADVRVVSLIHEVAAEVPGYSARRGLLFVGGFGHPPNVDGMEWFLAEVWPRLDEKIRSAGIDVVGSRVPDSIKAFESPQIRIHGWVDDVSPLINAARLSVAPLRFGAGVKGKIAEAWAAGLPVVGTSLAFEGMADTADAVFLAGDTPDDYAKLVSQYYLDESAWTAVSLDGRRIVADRFSSEAARRGIDEVFAAIGVQSDL